jgi:ABC-2 type transport system ATP-binding protein
MSGSPAIKADGLTRKFGDFTAVDRVSFEIPQKEIFGYLGANGAGKSTTIRMLCGLLGPTSGSAEVAGTDVSNRPQKVKSKIGYMSQKFSLYLDLTVEENLSFFAGVYRLTGKRRRTRVSGALELSGLTDRRDHLTSSLPGGLRQRLALASAMLHEPEILFLDEPTAGVDPASRRDFWKIIRRLSSAGTTLFVTTHHLDEAEYCNRVGLMVDGELVALDTPEALKRDNVQGVIYSVTGPNLSPKVVREALAETEGVWAARGYGAGVRVRVDESAVGPERLERALGGAGLSDMRVEQAEPTLEDVFLEIAAGDDEKPDFTESGEDES